MQLWWYDHDDDDDDYDNGPTWLVWCNAIGSTHVLTMMRRPTMHRRVAADMRLIYCCLEHLGTNGYPSNFRRWQIVGHSDRMSWTRNKPDWCWSAPGMWTHRRLLLLLPPYSWLSVGMLVASKRSKTVARPPRMRHRCRRRPIDSWTSMVSLDWSSIACCVPFQKSLLTMIWNGKRAEVSISFSSYPVQSVYL